MAMKTTMVVITNADDDRYAQKFFGHIGPKGELLLEYTIYDAIESGFDRIVLIATLEIRELIKDRIERKFSQKIEIYWVDSEPLSGFSFRKRIRHQYFDENNYALWKAKTYLTHPFLVVDAKCYHGKRSFERAKQFLSTTKDDFGTISLPLGQTLSPYGGVDRALCFMKKSGLELKKIVALQKIRKMNGAIGYLNSKDPNLSDEMPTTDMFCLNTHLFEAHITMNDLIKKSSKMPLTKIKLPDLINFLVKRKMVKVKVLMVHSNWFGTQFKPERILAKGKINSMIANKLYPSDLGPPFKNKKPNKNIH